MSRSKKHSPFFSYTTALSEKADKRFANRKLRHTVDQELDRIAKDPEIADEVVLPEIRDVSDRWFFDKDGKHYWNPDPTLDSNLELWSFGGKAGKNNIDVLNENMRK